MHTYSENLSVSKNDGRWLTLRARLKKTKTRNDFILNDKEVKCLYDKGLEIVRNNGFDFFRNHLAKTHHDIMVTHTPLENHPFFTAQKATATCCRDCIAKWHEISPLNELSSSEVSYLVDIAMLWLLDNIDDDVPVFKQYTLF